MKILVTGGFGLLGSEIRKLDNSLITPDIKELDITNMDSISAALDKYRPDAVLHLAAATSPPEHEGNPALGMKVNIAGTVNVALACLRNQARLVFTSSDYFYSGHGPHKEDEPVNAPNNFYLSKLAAECAVRMCPNSLVLRLSFGPVPFPYEAVYSGQYTSKLYADEMAPLVLKAAKSAATGILNLGGPRVSLEEYAKRTKPGIKTVPKPAWVPKDTSLDLTLMKSTLEISDEKLLLKH